ncbi:3-keto-5-aminohexanoate cleavage protein [Bradyrhizobium genosp. A]|uniref:3-keto-5-aminohexanoate cleavage protein n=1 Tax=Bradyrhizobium genosp. A TaxID=83626 RepID=UPI003CF45E64
MTSGKTIITCAITGNLTKPEQSPYLPITPEQIATSALEAAEAGAVIAHIHVRDPATGRPSMSIDLYRDVVERIRARNKSLVINLTTGPGGRFVLGVKYGFSATPETMFYARSLLPPGAIWSGFGIGRAEFPMVAQAWLLGGHVRVGMEDNLYMSKGVLAKTNAELVAHAASILKNLGATVATAQDARAMLGLA